MWSAESPNVRVWETVPDKVFDAADEVVLVDIPADELLARLKAGKVYVAQQAEHAAQHFFRKGNLMALRELALRRTADRIEGDVQAYRVDQSIESVWKTATALLTCVGPDAAAERVVRAAARLAGQLNTEWHAIYVETPSLQRLAPAKREKILANLNLAQQLGATTAVIASAEIAESIIAYARKHNLSKLVIGRDPIRRLWPWQRSSGQKLAMLAPDIDLIEIGRAENLSRGKRPRERAFAAGRRPGVQRPAQGQAAALFVGRDRLCRRDADIDAAGGALRSLQHCGHIHFGRGAGRGAARKRAGRVRRGLERVRL